MKKPDGQQMSASRASAGWYVGDCKTKWTMIQSQAECLQQMQEGGWPIYTKKRLIDVWQCNVVFLLEKAACVKLYRCMFY